MAAGRRTTERQSEKLQLAFSATSAVVNVLRFLMDLLR
jgi:hypothetical protein